MKRTYAQCHMPGSPKTTLISPASEESPAGWGERLVKSSERVRDIGEVFTPSATVRAMLDLLPGDVWTPHPPRTFFEPACGDGNFLVAILQRKLAAIGELHRDARLPAGATTEAVQFHALEALASIYAVDISVDNVVGGTPGHEIGARQRLLNTLFEWHRMTLGTAPNSRARINKAATWIVEHNILVGNMLAADAAGRPTGRERLPLIEYEFVPASRTAALGLTMIGAAIEAAKAESSGELSLFGLAQPAALWSGPALDLASADRIVAPKLKGPARNGAGTRR